MLFRTAWTLSFFCALCATACEAPSFAADELVGRVVRVADGDTITIQTAAGKQEKIRLFGIDAPERGQAFGRKSQQTLAALVAGKEVVIEIEDEDRYGRLVGMVYRGDTNVNARMVEAGMAWVYRRYMDDPQWLDLEERARDEGRGLWRDPDPVWPGEWRSQNPR